MYLCYIDESGTSAIPGNSSHFILASISIPIRFWKDCDRQIAAIKKSYGLLNSEIHIAWLLRSYLEQNRIENFSQLEPEQRISAVTKARTAEIFRLQKAKNPRLLKQTKKNFKKTADYIHLSYDERKQFIVEIAKCVSQWSFARLFAECIDKIHFDPIRFNRSIDEQSFEQIVSRIEQYLQITGKTTPDSNFGLLIHDNNETIAQKHTQLMKQYHQQGTFWTKVSNIIETPLFVDSQLTSMVQVADVCAYALRRYVENGEEELFNLIFQRADRKDGLVVGVRHFTKPDCVCKICQSHRKNPITKR